jgi:hypothetical protein
MASLSNISKPLKLSDVEYDEAFVAGPPAAKRARIARAEETGDEDRDSIVAALAEKAITSSTAAGGASTETGSKTPPRSPASKSFSFASPAASPAKAAKLIAASAMPPQLFKIHKNLTGAFVQSALKIHSDGFILKGSESFKISSIAGAKGQHSQVYTISGPSEYISGTNNKDLVVKMFQEDVILKKGKPGIEPLIVTLLKQYKELQSTDLPIIQIYNSETAIHQGFVIAERVTPVILPWDASTSAAELKTSHLPLLTSIKSFVDFALAQTSTIPLDLNEGNFGINKDGKLVLLDFMEHEEEDIDISVPGAAFNMIKANCFASLSKENSHVLSFLNGEEL